VFITFQVGLRRWDEGIVDEQALESPEFTIWTAFFSDQIISGEC